MTENTGDTNPFSSLRFLLPEREIVNRPIDRDRLELIVCRSIIIDLAKEIQVLREHPMYGSGIDNNFKFNVDQANRFLFQVKSLAGIEFRRETGASPLFQLTPTEITIYNANCLLSVVEGHLWEARAILNQYNQKIQILLEIADRLVFKQIPS